MEEGQERPWANADPPRLDEPKEILQELLDIERDRLKTAVRIEKERNIVFPETTVIIRDIQKLMKAIEGNVKGEKDGGEGFGVDWDEKIWE